MNKLIDAADLLKQIAHIEWKVPGIGQKMAEHQIRQAIEEAPAVVAFKCDRHACDYECPNDECQHTLDIRHAVSFKEVAPGRYMERTRTRFPLTCRDCRHWLSVPWLPEGRKVCGLTNDVKRACGFCDFAERRKEE